jgi:hypothetical protein
MKSPRAAVFALAIEHVDSSCPAHFELTRADGKSAAATPRSSPGCGESSTTFMSTEAFTATKAQLRANRENGIRYREIENGPRSICRDIPVRRAVYTILEHCEHEIASFFTERFG